MLLKICKFNEGFRYYDIDITKIVTIGNLIQKLRKESMIPIKFHNIMRNNIILDHSKSITELNINENNKIFYIVRMRY